MHAAKTYCSRSLFLVPKPDTRPYLKRIMKKANVIDSLVFPVQRRSLRKEIDWKETGQRNLVLVDENTKSSESKYHTYINAQTLRRSRFVNFLVGRSIFASTASLQVELCKPPCTKTHFGIPLILRPLKIILTVHDHIYNAPPFHNK
jgi:hypothetical protein